MQTKRLKKNKLHKLLLKCFGSVINAGRALGFSKQAIYCWINPDGTDKPPRHKLAKGFDEHEKDIAKLKKMLGVKT